MSPTSIPPESNDAASPPKYDLFVVHSEADRAWVEGYLRQALGLDPARVLTPREFRLGESIAAEFERGVTSSRFTLLVLSPAFLADRWAEFGEGLVSFSSVDDGRNRLLALTLHACQAPLRLRFRESLDCSDSTHWDEETARLRRHLDAPEPAIEAVVCPYPGMVPFRNADARFFHGRDEEIQTLLGLIRNNHFLVVIGSSGSGKSSLVTAGLLPKLDDPRNFPRGTWRVLTMRPGATPVEKLSQTLPGAPSDPAEAISSTLAAEPAAQKLLLVVDQFEELFSQVKDASIRSRFIGHLKALRSDPRCTVIMTMRADFYGDLMNSPLWPINQSEIIEVAALRGEAMRQAIIKPAESVGVCLEDGLIERLIADAAGEPGALPMLQEALVVLWGTMSRRLLTRSAYERLGRGDRSGLAVALAMKADANVAALPPDQKRLGKRIFLRLIQFGEGRPDTRRQLGVDELRALTDDPKAFAEFLDMAIANRLLTSSVDEKLGLRLDISHEMLISGWPAARAWVEAHRSAEKTRRRLVGKAEEWARLGRLENGLLDSAGLAEADAWLNGPDADDLGIDADVSALAEASRRAIRLQNRRKARRLQLTIGGLVSALIVISWLAVWGDLKWREAVIAKIDAEKNADLAKVNAAEVLIEAGSTALANGHSFDAMHRFAGAIATLPPHSRLESLIRRGLGFLERSVPRLETIVQNANGVGWAAFSPDGARIVTASATTARIWRADSGALVAELKGNARLFPLASFSPDGTRVVTVSDDEIARVWSAGTGALVAELKGHAGRLISAAFSPDGTRVVTGSDDNTARVWSADSGKLVAELKGHLRQVLSATFSPDGTRIATASYDGTARVWAAESGTLLVELKGHTQQVFSARFSADGTRIVTASYDRTARVWKAGSGALLAELRGHADMVLSAAFSPDGTRIVTVSNEKTARIWSSYSGTLLVELKGHADKVVSAAFSRDGIDIVTASSDKTARVWRAGSGALLAELKGHADKVVSAAFSPDGTRIVTSSYDRTARVWRNHSGALGVEVKGHAGGVYSAAFSPDCARIVTASSDRTARIWRTDPIALLAELKGHSDYVISAAFSLDGTRIVTASWDKTARVWKADSGTSVAELKGHAGKLNGAAFSPDGTRIVTASWDNTGRIWRADTGALVAELRGHSISLTCVAFSPDGARVVSAAGDGTRVWKADSGAFLFELKGQGAGDFSASFSPDGTRIVTSSNDNTARVWRADSGILLAELKGHSAQIWAARFSPDGSRVVTSSSDRTARVWMAESGILLAELKGHADRVSSAEFSPDGTHVVTASDDTTARVWEAESGNLLAELVGHSASVETPKFSVDGTRILTASLDNTARIWRFETISGDASILPRWVETLTGTVLKGGVVEPLDLDVWNQRKAALEAQSDKTPADDWIKTPTRVTNDPTARVK